MYYSEHGVAHFHAVYGEQYGEHQAAIAVRSLRVIDGYLPARALALVRAWARMHIEQLEVNWVLTRQGEPSSGLRPLSRSGGTRMIPRVKEVEVVGPHSLRLTFHDGATKRVNLLPLLQGPIFQPLLQPSYFGQVLLDPVAGTVVWPNGADIAPETLYGLPEEETGAKARSPRQSPEKRLSRTGSGRVADQSANQRKPRRAARHR